MVIADHRALAFHTSMAADKTTLKEFKDAATQAGLKKASIDKLLAEDFDSMDTVKLLTGDDVSSLELTRGQQRLMERWMTTLQHDRDRTMASDAAGVTPNHAQETATLDALAKSLSQDIGDDLWTDQQDSGGIVKTGRPFLICDHVTRATSGTEEQYDKPIFSQGGAQLFLRNKQKPAPESVSLPQWISANARVLAKLITEGALKSQEDILAYLEYNMDFGDYAQVNEIESVMIYDHEYRKKQCRTNRKWGEDDIHLANFYLQRKRDSFRARSHGHTNNHSRPPRLLDTTGVEVCRNYNASGCYRSHCVFAHVCMICKQKGHSKKSHRDVRQNDEAPSRVP